MNRQHYYDLMTAPAKLDYELYLDTGHLLACQKPFQKLVNADELQFQIVHQVEELWMKLIIATLLDIDDHIQAGHAHKVVTLFTRTNLTLKMMSNQLDLLETHVAARLPADPFATRQRLGPGIAGLPYPDAHDPRVVAELRGALSHWPWPDRARHL
ncbi:MAG: tryptophan 2,3-dioxygenase family protein [Asticcacaulis sp.]